MSIGLPKAGLLLTTAIAGGMMTAPAMAQTADQSSGAGGGDIIVTARRVEERLQDVPISITVFNQKQLDNHNIVNAEDLSTYTPSLSSNSAYGSQNSTFAIRGFVQDAGTPPSVGVYFADVVAPRGAINEIPVGDGAGPGSFFDLQNVQVLKGPQGTLFGRNTTGGAVLLVPQKPTDKLEGYIQGSLGTYDMRRFQGVLNLPISSGARLRLGVDHQTRTGYLKNDSGFGPGDFNDIDYTTARASLVLDITPDIENYTVGTYTHSDTNGDLQKLVACSPGAGIAALLGPLACASLASEKAKGAGYYTVQNIMPDARTLLNQWQVINTTTWRVNDALTVKNIVSYAQLHEKFASAIFGTLFDLSPLAGLPAGSLPFDPFPNRPLPGRDSAAQSTFTDEFRLQGNSAGGRLNWQAGVYLESSRPLGQSGMETPTFVYCPNQDDFQCKDFFGFGSISQNGSETTFHNVGLYAQGTYSLTDQLKLTGGFRYTWDRQKVISQVRTFALATQAFTCSDTTNPSLTAPDCFSTRVEKAHAPTWLIDLDYKPVEDVLLYAKYARGYRAGGLSPDAPLQFQTFDPEKVDTYEVGVKSTFSDALHATLNVSGFYNNFTNQQLHIGLLPNPGFSVPAAGAIVNAGKSRIYGFEVEASIMPFAGLSLNASYSYLNATIRQIISPVAVGGPYSVSSPYVSGDPLFSTPRNQYVISGTYQLPIAESVGRISFGATFSHTDAARVSYDHATIGGPSLAYLDFATARNLLNLNLNWDKIGGGPFDLDLFLTNVTNNKSYVPNDLVALGYETAVIGEPRMFGVRLRYSFGR